MAERTPHERVPEHDPAFFAPDRAEERVAATGAGLPVRRLVLRLAVLVLALVAVDTLVARMMPSQAAYRHSYRLPAVAPTSALADYVEAIDLAADESTCPVVVFLGASPTFGHRIKSPANTFPYAYAAAAASEGVTVRAFNVGLNGAYVGDEDALARALADSADIVFVQLTYHTFARTGGPALRYPELPSMLGVLGRSAAAAPLRTGATAPATPAIGRWLGTRWRLWRYRDVIDRRLFGGTPRGVLDSTASRLLDGGGTDAQPTVLPSDAPDDGFAAFDELDPGAQMVVIARYAEESSFSVTPTSTEVASLDRLARFLAASGKRAVFFMGPLNWDVIDDYELVGSRQYRSNVRVIAQTLARHGFPLIDHNRSGAALPREDFADISHTTDAGGQRFGALLHRDTRELLRSVAK